MGERFKTKYCGESCHCGQRSEHKIAEDIPPDDPWPSRHPLTAYVCHACFVALMGAHDVALVEGLQHAARLAGEGGENG